jgi:hypothetical protein
LCGAFLLTLALADDLKVKDGFNSAWMGLCGIANLYYAFVFFKFGNDIIKVLQNGMDQSSSVQDATERVSISSTLKPDNIKAKKTQKSSNCWFSYPCYNIDSIRSNSIS